MKLSILLFSFFAIPLIFGQQSKTNYRIHAGDSPFIVDGNLQSNWRIVQEDVSCMFEGHYYVLLQLNGIPSSDQKATFEFYGITLLKYIPNYAWLAKVESDMNQQTLSACDVRHILPVDSSWKINKDLAEGNVPPHAGSELDAQVNILFLELLENASFETLLNEYEISIDAINEERNTVRANGTTLNLRELAKHPLVQYIECVEPPIEFEGIKEERERIISPYIANNPGKGYYFDGTGVRIAVDEGGILDTLENPNFRSRIVRTFENGTNVGGHKTSVGIRMAKAGNIDPREQGTAFGADLYSGGVGTTQATSSGIVIVNRSYGWGCPGNGETYNGSSASYDFDVRTNPTFIITHSAGNAGGSNCYAGAAGWGNITGMPKMAKNIFNVGSSGNDGNLMGFSSRGPSKDGRILPHIVAPGPGGTSHASPNLAGVFAQLNQAYRYHNNNAIPLAGLLKAILMNTADDMLNPGPDFKTGFGHVNARRAYEVIREGNYLTASIAQGASNNHTIIVPPNVKELKVMVYWVDWEATAGISTRSLVNDLDIVLENPNTTQYQPWVLNPAFDPITLDQLAVRASDSLNNHEQVTVDSPIAGNYTLSVSGTLVPQGPQSYFMTYEFVFDEIVVTYPHGGEKLVPGETERIRWDACDSNLSFDLSYSEDNGTTWNTIATNVNADSRFLDWTVPQDLTNQGLIKVERGATLGESDTMFSISEVPENLELIWSCADSSLFVWDAFPNADGYVVYRIVGDYMDSVMYTTSNAAILNSLSLSSTEYISIAVVQNGVTSRRVIAIEREPSDLNCNMDDLGAMEVVSPGTMNMPSCMSNASEVKVSVRNWGVNAVDSIPVAYQLNGGSVVIDTIFAAIPTGGDDTLTFMNPASFLVGTNVLEVWTDFSGDGISMNDTVVINVNVYPSVSGGPSVTEDFDSFTNCSTAWDCELVDCNLQNGWYNIPNGSGDEIDWRTHSGGTGSGNTGPSADHTSGSGKYVYLEGSGPCNNSTALLYSPCLDLTGINSAELSFWYHAWGASIGELHVDAISNGIFYEDIMTPIVGDQGNQWLQQVVDLSPFGNTQLVVILRGSNGSSGWTSDMALDDINIAMGPVAEYVSSETQVCSNESISLLNTSLYGDTYDWSFQPNTVTFEGGTNSNSMNPEVSFNGSGWYTVQLVASNTVGADTLTFVDYIYVWESTPQLSASAFCEGDSIIVQGNNNGQPVDYYLNGALVTSSISPSNYFPNATQGDSVFAVYQVNSSCAVYSDTVVVTINDVETGIAQSGLQLEAQAVGAQYQWLDCANNYLALSGAINVTFTPLTDGEYAVQITQSGCVDTSNCLVFSTTSLNEWTTDQLICFPNPTTGNVTVKFEQSKAGVSIDILTVLGQKVGHVEAKNTLEMEVKLPEERAVYLLEITTEAGMNILRVVKK